MGARKLIATLTVLAILLFGRKAGKAFQLGNHGGIVLTGKRPGND